MENRGLEEFDIDSNKVAYGNYTIKPPLVKPSNLTSKDKGGVGKELSDGYAINYAIGCTHACRFCYVDNIHKRFTLSRLNNDAIINSWGMYLLTPSNIDEAIDATNWSRWKGKEVLMSSTHDPYLPQLADITRKILEASLPHGVRYCIQTRSTLVLRDLDLLEKYREQVRLQISISTLDYGFARAIEPRVPSSYARLNILREAKKHGIKTGIIIAPLFPTYHWRLDLEEIIKEVKEIDANNIYGECIHVRGNNTEYLADVEDYLVKPLNHANLKIFDKEAREHFYTLLGKYDLKGTWWGEY